MDRDELLLSLRLLTDNTKIMQSDINKVQGDVRTLRSERVKVNVSNQVTANSNSPVSSGAVYTYVNQNLSTGTTLPTNGTTGQVLTSQGTSNVPVWADAPGPLYFMAVNSEEEFALPGYPTLWEIHSSNGGARGSGKYVFKFDKAGSYRLDYVTEFEFVDAVNIRQVEITVFKQKLDANGNEYEQDEVAHGSLQRAGGVGYWQMVILSIVNLDVGDYISIFYDEKAAGDIVIHSNTKLLMTKM